jgi:hypothetical protein
MPLPHKIEATLGVLALLAQANRHDESTFTPENQALFAQLRSALSAGGIDVEGLVDKMVDGALIDVDELKMRESFVKQRKSASTRSARPNSRRKRRI